MTLTKELEPDVQELERVTIRFAGDSGDGMQLTGTQFTRTAAVFGNDISTLPDFPAEIRAPAGSLPGVSGFQISFSSSEIHTPGDQPDVLVAMNPAALKTNIGDLPPGGALIVNSDAFTQQNLNKAAYTSNPLTDGSLKAYTVFEVPISTLNTASLQGLDMTSKQMDLTKNFFALGLMFWLYERSQDGTIAWIDQKFGARPVVAEANKRALRAGYAFGETTEAFHTHYRVKPAKLDPGVYRNITGNEATALGFLVASKLADRQLFYGSYPITPASDILHQLSGYKTFGVKTFQAEDEIAAIGRRHRRVVRRGARADRLVGPRDRAEDRGDGSRGHGRAAAGGHRCPARRPLDRDADQERAGGPPPGDVRAQLGLAVADRRAGHARRVLRPARSRPSGWR